jgi:S1-C subfamily serine protease
MKMKRLVLIGLAALLISAGINYKQYRVSHPMTAMAAQVYVDEFEQHPPDGKTVAELHTIDTFKLPYMRDCTVVIENSKRGRSSGVIIDAEKGIILTCAHGTERGDNVKIKLNDGSVYEAYQFQIRRFLKYDLALIYVGHRLGNSTAHLRTDPVRLGEEVIAVGTPTGQTYFFNSLSFGRITGMDRSILKGQSHGSWDWSAVKLIQTDTPINSGNSGGPLFDVRGRIVGINVMSMPNRDGLSMAVPTKYVLQMLEEVK